MQGGLLKQFSKILQGIDKELAQQINKTIKNSKLKVQVAIRGDEVRVSSNKRDLLQSTIQIIKEMKVKQLFSLLILETSWHKYFID